MKCVIIAQFKLDSIKYHNESPNSYHLIYNYFRAHCRCFIELSFVELKQLLITNNQNKLNQLFFES